VKIKQSTFAWALLGLVSACSPQTQRLERGTFRDWNLLLVTIDTLRWDRVGAYGKTSGLTPNLDRLASEGIRFETAYTSAPLTLPAHVSLFTGVSPPLHGVRDNGTFRFSGDVPTLAGILRERGYDTGAFVGAFVLDARFGLDRDFDEYDDRYRELAERKAEAVMEPAVEWIDERDSDDRWFAWVHFFDPHTPYDAPTPYAANRDPYDAEVAYSDDVLGRLLKHLKEKGKLDRTLIVVTSDHGESLGDHGERTHGVFTYDSTLRVPLVIWSQRGMGPKVVQSPVRLIDLAPTLVDLFGLPIPPNCEGRSLIGAVNEDETDMPPAYFEAMNAHLSRNWAPLAGVVAGGYKFVDLPIPELYDLENDPEEQNNLHGKQTDKVHTLIAQLDRIRTAHASEAPAETERIVTPHERSLLESLGYVRAGLQPQKPTYSIQDDPKTLIAAANRLEDAQKMFSNGETDRGMNAIRAIIAEHPGYSSAYVVLASMLRNTGGIGEAIALLQKAQATNDRDPSLTVNLGVCLQQAGRLAEAAKVLERLLEAHPDYLDARSVLGTTLVLLGRPAEARQAFKKVLEVDPTAANAYENLGILAIREGHPDEAVTHLERAVELDPRLPSAWSSLGLARAQAGDSPGAVQAWKGSLELDPNRLDVVFNLGMHLVASGHREEATAYLERFVQEAPHERYAAQIQRTRRILATEH
jgi:arylsulfatase A-like enzyme/Flp pilus assembly protein TadD